MLNFYNSHFLTGDAAVIDAILPGRKGRVRFKGTVWPARCKQNISFTPGEIVAVVGIQKATLLVEPSSSMRLPQEVSDRDTDRGME